MIAIQLQNSGSAANNLKTTGMLLDMSNKTAHYPLSLIVARSWLRPVLVYLDQPVDLAVYDVIVDQRLVIVRGILQTHPVFHAAGASQYG